MVTKIFLHALTFLLTGIVVGQNHSIIYKREANIENQLKNEHRPKIRERVAKRLSIPSYFELLVSPKQSL